MNKYVQTGKYIKVSTLYTLSYFSRSKAMLKYKKRLNKMES